MAIALSGNQTITGNKLFNTTTLQLNNPAATFQYIVNASAIVANRNVTLPLLIADDTFVFSAFTQTLTNKTMSGSQNTFSSIPSAALVTLLVSHTLDDTNTIVGSADNTKILAFSLGGMTTGKTITLTLANTTSQTLNVPNITASDTLAVLGLAQTYTKLNTYSPVTTNAISINPASAPTGSSSAFKGGLISVAGTVAFATTAQTGDYTTNYIDIATLTNPSSGAVPNASTVKIVGGPVASTNVTITNKYALWVLADKARFDGGVMTSTIYDSNANTAIAITATSSAVNYATIVNAATNNAITINATGSDSNISGVLTPKGTGIWMGSCETIELDLTDETSLPTASSSVPKITTGIPYNFSVVSATAYVTTAGTGATLVEMDAKIESAKDSNSFSTIFTTRPKIAASTFTSNSTGSTAAVLTSTPLALTKDTRIQGLVYSLDSNSLARGYKILLVGYRTS